MEKELTIEELITLMNESEEEFFITVEFGEGEADGEETKRSVD